MAGAVQPEGAWHLRVLNRSQLAEDVFGIPACIARVKGISDPASILENPKYSCVIGLVKLS